MALVAELQAAAKARGMSANQLILEVLEAFAAVRRLSKLRYTHTAELEMQAESRKAE